jgi:hypothetical protein
MSWRCPNFLLRRTKRSTAQDIIYFITKASDFDFKLRMLSWIRQRALGLWRRPSPERIGTHPATFGISLRNLVSISPLLTETLLSEERVSEGAKILTDQGVESEEFFWSKVDHGLFSLFLSTVHVHRADFVSLYKDKTECDQNG